MLRFDLPCEALGFEPPPASLQLRFLPHGTGWTLVILVAAGKAREAKAWLNGQAPDARITTAPGLAPRTLRCELDPVPAEWLGWLTAARIIQVSLAQEGTATLFVQGTALQLADLASKISDIGNPVRHRVSATRPLEEIAITPRQLEVLCNAVAMGYYDVPHRIDLRQLGKAMDLSVSAVSQLLRRAQGQIIRGFIDGNTLASGKRLGSDNDQPGPPKEA